MAEAVFRKVQVGKETTPGTEVDATMLLINDAGSGELSLARGTNVPEEDFGRISRNQTGRGSHGIRLVTGSATSVMTFQQLPVWLQMTLGVDAPTGGGPYAHVFAADETASTFKAYTWEVDDDTADWTATGVVCTSLEMGFDALAPGENAPWKLSAELQGMELLQKAATAAIADPTAAETMEGHLTVISAGAVGTAFGSLGALTGSLIQYSFSIDDPKPLRPYGGTTDVATSIGRGKGLVTVNFMLKDTSANIDETFDIFTVAGALPTERRVRVAVDGSGNMSATIDHRLLITDAHVEDGRDGERVLAVTAEAMYDATLASRIAVTVNNDTATY